MYLLTYTCAHRWMDAVCRERQGGSELSPRQAGRQTHFDQERGKQAGRLVRWMDESRSPGSEAITYTHTEAERQSGRHAGTKQSTRDGEAGRQAGWQATRVLALIDVSWAAVLVLVIGRQRIGKATDHWLLLATPHPSSSLSPSLSLSFSCLLSFLLHD